jgi:hypothetical protein
MALIEIRADLSRVAKALERMVELLEKMAPPTMYDPNLLPSTEEDFHVISYEVKPPGDDDIWTTYGPRRNY